MKQPETISIIVAIDKNNAIGKNNQLLCYLPEDLKFFKKTTTGHCVIMGHHTFKSLPNGALPNRKNIVLTSDKNLRFQGCISAGSIDEALEYCKDEKEVFFIGGEQVYKTALARANKLYITEINYKFNDADKFFPKINDSEWEIVREEKHKSDEKNPYDYTFFTYEKRKK